MKEMLKSPIWKSGFSKIILIIGGVVVVIIIFLIGENVGYHKAEFSYRFGNNYSRIFGRRTPGMIFDDNTLLEDNGASGMIVKISLPEIFLEGDNGVEQIITLANNSLVKEFRATIASSSLKVGDEIIVLGEPGMNGAIKAGLVRVIATSTNE